MQTPVSQVSSRTLLQVASRQLAVVLLLLLGLAFIPGCPGGAVVADVVSGPITVDDKPCSGMVTFIGPDKKEQNGAALDGKYEVLNPPKGLCKIIVKAGPPTPVVKEFKDGPTGLKPTPAGTGVAPPPKYEKAETSDLTFEFKGGKVENIPIKMTSK